MPRTLRISRRNSTYQVLESLLSNRQKRHRSGTFLIEGVRPIDTALAHGWPVEAVLYAEGVSRSAWAEDIVSSTAGDRLEMSADLLRALSRRDEGSELLVLARMPSGSLERIEVSRDLLVVVMDRPGNPGNLGTLMRSCDAFGAQGLIISGHGVDVYDPAVITASRGSLFALPVVSVPSHAEIATWVDGVRERLGLCQVVGGDERAATVPADHDFTIPTLLVVGNETLGLSHAYQELCGVRIRIPMSGSASSLNVSVAASVLLYEARRQRSRAPGAPAAEVSGPGEQ